MTGPALREARREWPFLVFVVADRNRRSSILPPAYLFDPVPAIPPETHSAPVEDVGSRCSLATVQIEAPMATIRSLRSQLEDDDQALGAGLSPFARPSSIRAKHNGERLPIWDPVVQGHLTMAETNQVIDMWAQTICAQSS